MPLFTIEGEITSNIGLENTRKTLDKKKTAPLLSGGPRHKYGRVKKGKRYVRPGLIANANLETEKTDEKDR